MLSQKVADTLPLASELAGYISSEVNRLNALVSRFLDFARPMSLEARPLRISEVVDRSLESVQHQLPDLKVKVERHYAAAETEILADEQLCERVFVNLIVNACQAMAALPEGERVLCVSVLPEISNGETGEAITIEDTGPGVPAEIREQIFNPFFTSKKDGVGLGLSIVAKIVDAHRGWIKLESEPGRGARFHVFLPVQP
jgi:signal transduction histidine kinase